MAINCIVIDDDELAIEAITEYIYNIPELALIASFNKPLEALEFVKNNEDVDIAFLDVEMPVISGIEFSGLVKDKIKKIVFTTAHAIYAFEAFQVHAVDFLLKPFNFSRFANCVNRLFPVAPEMEVSLPGSADYVFIKNREEDLKLIKVYYDEIVAIESLSNYIRIYTLKNNIVTHISLKDVKEALSRRNEFVQVHRSFIVSINQISAIDGNILTMSTGIKFTTGEHYRDIINDIIFAKMLRIPRK